MMAFLKLSITVRSGMIKIFLALLIVFVILSTDLKAGGVEQGYFYFG